MSARAGFQIVGFQSSVRFIQGYRFLDRCGEALIQIEKHLDEGWIQSEVSPTGGLLQNFRLGMHMKFQSESMSILNQDYISFDHFSDQACKLLDILCDTFGVEEIRVPNLLVIGKVGFKDSDEAEDSLARMAICEPSSNILEAMGGRRSALSFVVCTEDDQLVWDDCTVHLRRRLECKTVRQVRQPTLDERLLQRLPLLTDREQIAVRALKELRKKQATSAEAALQCDVEHSYETQFDREEFKYDEFLKSALSWTETILDLLYKRLPRDSKHERPDRA